MPCFKCSNGKWRYGEHGNCQFDTLERCRAAEAAIHARENPPKKSPKKTKTMEDCGCDEHKKE